MLGHAKQLAALQGVYSTPASAAMTLVNCVALAWERGSEWLAVPVA